LAAAEHVQAGQGVVAVGLALRDVATPAGPRGPCVNDLDQLGIESGTLVEARYQLVHGGAELAEVLARAAVGMEMRSFERTSQYPAARESLPDGEIDVVDAGHSRGQ
jgi:hypothetical protein